MKKIEPALVSPHEVVNDPPRADLPSRQHHSPSAGHSAPPPVSVPIIMTSPSDQTRPEQISSEQISSEQTKAKADAECSEGASTSSSDESETPDASVISDTPAAVEKTAPVEATAEPTVEATAGTSVEATAETSVEATAEPKVEAKAGTSVEATAGPTAEVETKSETKAPMSSDSPTAESAPAAKSDAAKPAPASAEESPAPAAEEATPAAEASGGLERVKEPLRQSMIDRGFTELRTVQLAALDAADENRDLRITSQTGSGKTVALGLAMVPGILNDQEAGQRNGPSVVVIVPTRELAAQVRLELDWLYRGVHGVDLDCVTGGTSLYQDRRKLSRRPRILVGTPGRLLDHIRTGVLDVSGVRQLVMDEADQMLDLGFREDLEAILESMPSDRRTHLVSATFPAGIRRLAKQYQSDPIHVEGTRLGAANEDIEHIGYVVDRYNTYGALVNQLLLGEGKRTLVFVNTRNETAQIAADLAKDGFSALALSGELKQEERTRTLANFRSGTISVLVATDVAARGLDVPDVAMVIHTSPVRSHEIYTHRSGRTGRAGQKGRSILFSPRNKTWQVERVLRDAKINLSWQELPSAKLIKKTLKKNSRRRIWDAIAQGEGRTEDLVEHAKRLLEEHEAVDVITALLHKLPNQAPREPFDIKTREPNRDRYQNRNDGGGRRDGGYGRREGQGHYGRRDGQGGGYGRRDGRSGGDNRYGQNSGRSGGYQGQRDRYSQGGGQQSYGNRQGGGQQSYGNQQGGHQQSRGFDKAYDRFEINFGEKAGASPRRLLAMICRRGNITSRDVGSIRVGSETSHFEVSQQKTQTFEAKMREPDSRDPWVKVKRA